MLCCVREIKREVKWEEKGRGQRVINRAVGGILEREKKRREKESALLGGRGDTRHFVRTCE